jgi:hypothetical protein
MAFGNPVTNGTKVAEGTYGYVVSFDLSNEEIKTLLQVQMQDATAVEMGEVIDVGTDRAALFEYLEDVDCPDVAWFQEGVTVFVFLKTATWAYAATNRVAFWFYRDAEDIAALSDTIDVPQAARELLKQTVRKLYYLGKGKRVPYDVEQGIVKERARLGV